MRDFREQTVCFTGHRDVSGNVADNLRILLRDAVIEMIKKGFRYFGTGGALGFDTIAAQTVLGLKKEYPHIRLILVLPCKNQCLKWNENDIKIYNQILMQSDKVVYVSERYTDYCMMVRNRHLVDNSSVCICYQAKKSGGTAATVDYAVKKGLSIVNLHDMQV